MYPAGEAVVNQVEIAIASEEIGRAEFRAKCRHS